MRRCPRRTTAIPTSSYCIRKKPPEGKPRNKRKEQGARIIKREQRPGTAKSVVTRALTAINLECEDGVLKFTRRINISLPRNTTVQFSINLVNSIKYVNTNKPVTITHPRKFHSFPEQG